MSYFIQYVKGRIDKNKNFICAITGATGSGKSYSALRLGELFDPEFDIFNVCFTPLEFMNLVDAKTKKLKSGSCIMFDEMQVSMSHLEYQSMQSRVLNYVLQTFRHKNFILLVTSPMFSFINASARKLFHCRMETTKIHTKQKVCVLKPLLLQTNQDSGKVYQKYLRISNKKHGTFPLRTLSVALPSDKLLEDYESKKTRFTHELNAGIINDLEKLKHKGSKPLTEQQESIVKLLKNKKLIKDVAKKLKVNQSLIYRQIESIKKKGVKIMPKKQQNRVLYYDISGF